MRWAASSVSSCVRNVMYFMLSYLTTLVKEKPLCLRKCFFQGRALQSLRAGSVVQGRVLAAFNAGHKMPASPREWDKSLPGEGVFLLDKRRTKWQSGEF